MAGMVGPIPQYPKSRNDADTSRNLLERTLLDAANGHLGIRHASRHIAEMMSGYRWNWRHLARAVSGAVIELLGPVAQQLPKETRDTFEKRLTQLLRTATLATRMASPTPGAPLRGDGAAQALRLHEVVAGRQSAEAMLRGLFGILREILPFHIATYTEYYYQEGRVPLARGRFAVDGTQEFRWPARWIPVNPEIISWRAGGKRWIEDIEEFYAAHPEMARARFSVVAQDYEKRGARSFITVSRYDGERLRSSLTLARRTGDGTPPFRFEDQRLLDSLELDKVLRLVGEAYAAEGNQITQEINALFQISAQPLQVAQDAVRKLCTGFDWEYVAIFRVARARNRFEVVAEYEKPGAGLSVGAEYCLNLDEGMVGSTRRAGRTLRTGDVRRPKNAPPDWKPPFNYVRTLDTQVSAMCVPVRLGNEVEWILDCESSQEDAFQQPDQDNIEALVSGIEKTVALWFESRLNKALLDSISQGVVVVDEQYRIERLNTAAERMLGKTGRSAIGCSLPELGSSKSDRDILATQESSGVHLQLIGAGRQEIKVIARSLEPTNTFNRRIWLLDDLAEPQWIANLAYMRAVVQSVAAQTRGPLMLAQGLLRRVRRLIANAEQPGQALALLDQSLRSLARTDLTYERLVAASAIEDEPVRQSRRVPFDLAGAVTRIVGELIAPDELDCTVRFPPDLPLLKADPERLYFAVRSTLGYLISVADPDDQLNVSAWTENGKVTLQIRLAGSAGAPDEASETEADPIVRLENHACSTAELATAAVAAIVKAHAGSFVREDTEDGICIRLAGLDVLAAREA
jgi:PAS domain-containing protein